MCMYAAIVPIQFVHKFVKPKGEIPSQLDRSPEGIDEKCESRLLYRGVLVIVLLCSAFRFVLPVYSRDAPADAFEVRRLMVVVQTN